MRTWPLFVLFAAACGYDEARYQADYDEATCVFTVQCYPDLYASVDDCIAQSAGFLPTDTCVYDAAAARDCVSETEAMACPTDGAIDVPAACSNVYSGCGESAE